MEKNDEIKKLMQIRNQKEEAIKELYEAKNAQEQEIMELNECNQTLEAAAVRHSATCSACTIF